MRKGFVFLPVILIITLLGVVGYFAYKNTQLRKSRGNIESNEKNKGWYSVGVVNVFSISYPKDWGSASNGDGFNIFPNPPWSGGGPMPSSYSGGFPGTGIYLGLEDKTRTKSLSDWINTSERTKGWLKNMQWVTIGNKKVAKITYGGPSQWEGKGAYSYDEDYFIQSPNNNIYLYRFSVISDKKEDNNPKAESLRPTVLEILSSLTFK